MKTLTAFFLAVISFGALQAQTTDLSTLEIPRQSVVVPRWTYSFGMNYGYTTPTGGMKQYIRRGHGFAFNYFLEAPSRRIAAGLEFSWTGYGQSRNTTEYTFPDGTIAPMEVNVLNSFTSIMATSRLYLVLDGPVRPYATVKAGYTVFRTSLSIYDPDNGDPCEPLEADQLSLDGTLAYGVGGGLHIDAGWIFKNAPRGRFLIDLSSNVMQGGRVNYMSEKAPLHNSMQGTTRTREVEAQFINTETQVVHPHHVGYLYNSFVQMVDFRLGITFKMNGTGICRR